MTTAGPADTDREIEARGVENGDAIAGRETAPVPRSAEEGETPFGVHPGEEQPVPPAVRDHRVSGVAYGLLAYGWWGSIIPLYIWWLSDRHGVSEVELLALRIALGLPFLVLLLTISRRWGELLAAIRRRRTVMLMIVTTALIATNWFGFIYAIATERTLEASLGYYINPLVSIALGMIFLHERPRSGQWLAIILAAAAVGWLTVNHGLPWISLMLACSFGLYGLLRKRAHVDAMVGLTFEMGFLFPLAAGAAIFLMVTGRAVLGQVPVEVNLLLLGAGVVTVLPLLWFTHAARRLQLSTMGFLQYLAPTGQFVFAVLVFDEPFTRHWAITFALIWAALVVYSLSSVHDRRRVAREKQLARKFGARHECAPQIDR